MKNLLTLLIAAALLTGCAKEETPEPKPEYTVEYVSFFRNFDVEKQKVHTIYLDGTDLTRTDTLRLKEYHNKNDVEYTVDSIKTTQKGVKIRSDIYFTNGTNTYTTIIHPKKGDLIGSFSTDNSTFNEVDFYTKLNGNRMNEANMKYVYVLVDIYVKGERTNGYNAYLPTYIVE